jgi:hypothetical protein
VITLLTPAEALTKVANSVFLPDTQASNEPTPELLAQVARRAIAIMAPCATHELVHAIALSFGALLTDADAFQLRVEDIVEDLIVYGDILEMRDSGEESWSSERNFLLRPAPPSFVTRNDGSVAILGIAGDAITPLTAELNTRTVSRGAIRIIKKEGTEDLEGLLAELGLLRLPEKTWLRLPSVETAASHVANWRKELAGAPQCSSMIEDLQILDTAKSPTFYRGRWVAAETKHSGMYVARRPQRYGAALWCVVDLEKGSLRQFKDQTARGDRLRPFDIAWRLQAALDACAGNPQRFGVSRDGLSPAKISFYSPVPSWCERHLSIMGQKGTGQGSLFFFEMPEAQSAGEISFLHESLWLAEWTREANVAGTQ